MVLPNTRFRVQRKFLAAPYVAGVAVTHTNTNSFDVTVPSGAIPGDLLVMYALKASGAAAIPTPAGWSEVFNAIYGSSRVAAFTRIMQPGDSTFAMTGFYTVANYTQTLACRNVSTVDVFDRSSSNVSSQDITAASVSTSGPALVLWQGSWTGTSNIQSADVSVDVGRTIEVDHKPTTRTADRTVIASQYLEYAGPSGTTMFDQSSSDAGPRHWSTIALR